MFASLEVWAGAVNTTLLIALALINAYIAKTQRRERRDLVDMKRGLGINRRYTDSDLKELSPDTGDRRRVTDS